MSDVPRNDQDQTNAGRNPREGIEEPPDLTDEDEEALNRVWAKIAAEENLTAAPRKPVDDKTDGPGQDPVS